mgnify:CR=1 FL=1
MKTKVITCIKDTANRVKTKMLYLTTMASVTTARVMTGAYADGEAKSLMETAINIIAVLVFIPAGILTISGIISYASAHSEGDGPAQKKAINTLSAGIMLAALGVILKATAPTFSSIIAESI